MFSNLTQLRFLGLSRNSLSLATNVNAILPNSLGSLWLSSCEIKDLYFSRTVHNLGKLDLVGVSYIVGRTSIRIVAIPVC